MHQYQERLYHRHSCTLQIASPTRRSLFLPGKSSSAELPQHSRFLAIVGRSLRIARGVRGVPHEPTSFTAVVLHERRANRRCGRVRATDGADRSAGQIKDWGDCHKRPRPLTLRLSWRDVNGSRGLRKHLCELINQARHREGDALGSVNLLGERQRRAQRCHSAADIAPVTGVGAL